MKRYMACGLALGMMCGSSVFAQGFTGGDIDLRYSRVIDGDYPGNGAMTFSGSAEYGFTRNLAVQLDLSSTSYGNYETTAGNVSFGAGVFALHGIYHINETSSVGLYFGNEVVGASDGEFAATFDYSYVGVELGYETGDLAFEMNYSKPFNDVIGVSSSFGLMVEYEIYDAVSVIAEFDSIFGGDTKVFSVGGEYEVTDNFSLTGELGSVSNDTISEPFIGLSVGYNFGAERGATFERTGFSNAAPDF